MPCKVAGRRTQSAGIIGWPTEGRNAPYIEAILLADGPSTFKITDGRSNGGWFLLQSVHFFQLQQFSVIHVDPDDEKSQAIRGCAKLCGVPYLRSQNRIFVNLAKSFVEDPRAFE